VYTKRNGLANDDVARLFEDSNGDVWIASFPPAREPLVRWDRATETFHRYGEVDGLRPFTSAITFSADASGNVWTGFREGGLARYRNGRFVVLGRDDDVPPGNVTGVYLDAEHRLWIASRGGGLGLIDRPEMDRPRVVRYTTADGLASDFLLSVTGDSAGRIYVTSLRGIDRLDPDAGQIRHLSTADGFAGGEFTAALHDRSGALWFATTTGLARFVPEHDLKPSAPPILISSLRVAGVVQPISELGQASVLPFEIEPNQNNVLIGFFSLGFRPGEMLRYQYRLEGSGAEWSAPSPERSVNYANLAPGSYRFAVRAVGADGTQSPMPATASFTILPPVWRRWWFLGLTALVVTSAGAVFARDATERKRVQKALRRSREERLAELERVRKRIATDLHDDIGSSLTRISLLSEVVKQHVGDAGATSAESLTSIGSLSRELVDSLSDIVWAINPSKDHLSDLSQRMRHFVSDICTARQIDFRFDTPPTERDISVGANVRREVFLVFKEAVTNMARHSGCSEAVLQFRESEHGLLLRIADNGLGFDVERVSAGNGLRSMRERTQGLGGRFEIISGPGQGTIVTFTFPLGERAQVAAERPSGTDPT
jgi:signal transduction histidine kinase/streptogramin lyase